MFGTWSSLNGGLFDDFRRLEQQMEDLLSGSGWTTGIRSPGRGAYPPINVGSSPESVDVYLFAAGLDPKSLDLSIQQNLLTVAGERKAPAKQEATYYRRERFDGGFRRVVTLPEDVDPDKVSARYQDGILHIKVERQQAAKPRQIQVQ